MDCICPLPAALTTIPKPNCKENLGQIQRWLIQRAGFAFSVATPADEIASWTPLFAAAGSTKLVTTPYVENIVIPRPEPVTEGGGDNSTIDGIEHINGSGAITVTGQLAEVHNAIIKALKQLMCEVELVAYGINQYGNIITKDLDLAAPGITLSGIPIWSLFVSDAGNDGLNTRDKADFRFSLASGWRDDIVIVKPTDFNAKTALWPVAA